MTGNEADESATPFDDEEPERRRVSLAPRRWVGEVLMWGFWSRELWGRRVRSPCWMNEGES